MLSTNEGFDALQASGHTGRVYGSKRSYLKVSVTPLTLTVIE